MKIAVGLSGGVDSSVAALLLKEQGYDVIALFMQNWHDTTGTLYGDCQWKDDLAIAKMVAKKLDIPFHFVDLSSQYSKRVVDYMFSEYSKGRTPNPDVLCNREIKFDVFLKEALSLGADMVATGHYCRKETRVVNGKERYSLLAGVDSNKDQSYFLCQLSQQQLSKSMFPIGELTKPQVRELATNANLPSADKKDSQGICFVGKVDLPVFLQQKLSSSEGDVIDIPESYYTDNIISKACFKGYEGISEDDLPLIASPYSYTKEDGLFAGKHVGAHFYTVGQRRGLNIGGHKEPLFVVGTDVKENIVYTGEGKSHPGLYRKALFIKSDDVHWLNNINGIEENFAFDLLCRIRYRQPLQKARLFKMEEGVYLVFDEPQRGITPGQFAVWYIAEELIGSGVING